MMATTLVVRERQQCYCVDFDRYSKIYSVQHIQGSKNYNYAACCIRPVRDGVSSIEVGRRVVLTDCLYGMRDALEQGVLAPGDIGLSGAVQGDVMCLATQIFLKQYLWARSRTFFNSICMVGWLVDCGRCSHSCTHQRRSCSSD